MKKHLIKFSIGLLVIIVGTLLLWGAGSLLTALGISVKTAFFLFAVLSVAYFIGMVVYDITVDRRN